MPPHEPMRLNTAFATLGTTALLLAGCSDSGDDATSASESSTASSSTASTTASSTTASSSPEPSPSVSEESDETGVASGPQPTLGNAAPSQPAENSETDGEHPFGTPVVSGPCGMNELLKPGVSADGTYLVCIRDTVNDDRGVWVRGPKPTGEVVQKGDPCEDGYPDNPELGDKGAVDAEGRIMLCTGDKWGYGP